MAIRDTSVRYFDSTMVGAPALQYAAPCNLAVLDACLTNGFGAFSISSLTVVAGVATAVAPTHHLANPGAAAGLDVGVVIRLAGATGDYLALNRDWRATITDANTLTWEVDAVVPAGTATGTLTGIRAPLDFEIVFSASLKRVYRPLDPAATGYLVRVDASSAKAAILTGYGAMTDVDTGAERIPASGDVYHVANFAGASFVPSWRLLGDGRGLYLYNDTNSAGDSLGNVWVGDAVSWSKSADPWAFCIVGMPLWSYGNGSLHGGTSDYISLARASTGTAGAIWASRWAPGATYSSGPAVPDPITGVLLVTPQAMLLEGASTTKIRGACPGLYSTINAPTGQPLGDVINGGDLGPLLRLKSYGTQAVTFMHLLQIVGPWR